MIAPIFQAQFYDPGMKYIIVGQANNTNVLIYNTEISSYNSINYGTPFNLYSKYLIDGKKLVLTHENYFEVWINDWLPLNNFY